MNKRCKFKEGKWNCGSYAFNLYKEDIDQGDYCDRHYWQGRAHRAEALAQPEPVAVVTSTPQSNKGLLDVIGVKMLKPLPPNTKLYTTPAQRTWVGLTDDMAYTIALQRAIEWHCKSKVVPPDVAALCPHHAEKLNEALAQPEQEPTDIAALIQGMEVSIDVSTGYHDVGHRLFGTVTLVQENHKCKHGLILLVQDPQPNYGRTHD